MLSNSGSDERREYKGGKPGDQTGREWAVINWYNRPWTVMIRPKNPAIGAKATELAHKAADNNHIGYDQNTRYTFWQNLAKVGYDPAKITVNCNADCSAGVLGIYKAVGYLMNIDKLKNINPNGYTGNLRAIMSSTGLFEIHYEKKYLTSDKYLLPGDILLNEGHHTAINLDKGSLAGGSTVIDNSANYNNKKLQTAQYRDDKQAGTVWITKSNLNVRYGSSTTKYSIIKTIPKGTEVIWNGGLYNINGNTKWYLITVGNIKGYVSSDYLTTKPVAVKPAPAPKKVTTSAAPAYDKSKLQAAKHKSKTSKELTTTANLNIRYAAGSGEVITTLKKGTKVNWYGYYNLVGLTRWYLVQAGNYTGYCSSAYLK